MAKKKPKPRPYNPLAAGLVALTPAQKRWVNQQTTASLSPERNAILQAQQAAQADAAEQQARIAGFAKAAASMLTGQLPNVQKAYEGAINAQHGFNQQITDQFRNAAAQTPNAAGAIEATRVYGGIPADAFASDALGQYRLAQVEPAAELNLGQLGLRASAYEAQKQNKEFLGQLATLASKAPGIRAQLINDIRNNELQKAAARASIASLGLDTAKAQADVAYRAASIRQRDKALAVQAKRNQQTYEVQLKKYNLAVKKANTPEAPKPSEWLSKSNGYLTDTNGNPILNAKGKPIPVKVATGTKQQDLREAAQDARELRGNPMEVDSDIRQSVIDAGYNVGKYMARPDAKHVFSSPSDAGGYIRTTNDPNKAQRDSDYTLLRAQDYLMTTYHLSKAQARKLLKNAGWFPKSSKKK